ncbi:MAG: hypothetical protein NTY70_05070 [Burkholderiales bacterium]|nr:hypothetical protein [Burkholderiales bacterium]
MKLFKASDIGIFASASLLGHLLRGVIGAALLWWAWTHQAWPLAGLAAAALAPSSLALGRSGRRRAGAAGLARLPYVLDAGLIGNHQAKI